MGITKSQILAINHREGNALVSASAGSGKTFVVIKRIIELLKSGVSLDHILATTFTEAAAQEMKEKLRDELYKEINDNGDVSLAKQLDLISIAEISTIDSLCMNILKNYFYEINIDDCFTVCDDQESLSYKTAAINRVFDELYESKDEDFFFLIDRYREGKRGDDKLREEILKIINFCQTEESIDVVYDLTKNSYLNAEQIINNIIFARIKNTIDYILEEANILGYDFADSDNKKVRAQFETFTLQLRKIKACPGVVEAHNAIVFFENIAKKENISSNFDQDLKAKYGDLFDKYKEIIKKLSISVYSSKEAIKEDSNKCLKDIDCLFDLAKKVEEKYTELKKEDNKIDFSDIERYTLQLLKIENVRKAVSKKYQYIFIDEYQDTNPLQEKIVTLIGSDNEFLVGDSKQSIYGFRGCDPKFFNEKRERYDINSNEGTKIDLDDNFRCAKPIIDGVNEIFCRIMTKVSSGVDYESNKMVYGGLYREEDGVFEINYPESPDIEENSEESAEEKIKEDSLEYDIYSLLDSPLINEDEYQDQTKLVVNLIKQNIGKEYFDIKEKDDENLSKEENLKKKIKRLQQKDFAILARSKKRFAEIADALINCGFTVNFETNDSIAEYPEVKCIVNLLKYIDFKNQDVPLANTMISFGNFTEDELIEIRKGNEKILPFYECVERYTKKGNELASKVKSFLEYFDKIRVLAAYKGASELLTRIISETNFDSKLKASFLGKQKYTRVLKVIQEGQKGGKRYLVSEFIEYLTEALPKISEDEVKSDDAIKMMTIHKSKGLEFPFVILIDTDKDFSDQDVKANVVKSKEYGFGFPIYDEINKIKTNSAIKDCIKDVIKKNTRVEEMRLLYVALTRAKCEMHIVVMDLEKKKKTLSEANSYCDFLDFDSIPSVPVSLVNVDSSNIDTKKKQISLDIKNTISENLKYTYPYLDDILVPVKESVSKINKDYLDTQEEFEIQRVAENVTAEMGTIYHKVLQYIDFDKNAEEELTRLLNDNILTQEEYDKVELNKIENILSMSIFKEINGFKLYKEKGFCILVDAKEYGYPKSNEKILVQGIIDLLAISQEKIILIDYKLSSIYNKEGLIKEYEMQLKLYKEAVEKLVGRKVDKACLVNILSCTEIEV